MILFRKYYKSANDDIATNRELIDKIFNDFSQEKTKEKSRKVYSFGMRYGTAFAAILVLCIGIAVYPQISKFNEKPVIETPSVKTKEVYQYTADNTDMTFDSADEAKVKTTIAPESTPNTTQNENQNLSIARIANANVEEEENQAAIIINHEADISELKPVTEDEIQLATNTLIENLGTADKETGNIYSFEIAGKLETDDKSYYMGRWKWLVDDHMSLICEFVMSDDLNELYECVIYDNTVGWTTKNNIFK